MYIAQIRFGSRPAGLSWAKMRLLVELYVDSLGSAGRIGRYYFLNWVGGELVAHVEVSRPDAFAECAAPVLEHRYADLGRSYREDLRAALGRDPELVLLDDKIPKRFPQAHKSPFLVLCGEYEYGGDEHPIRNGLNGCPFRAYLFPLEHGVMHNLHCWTYQYRVHMGVWHKSGRLEYPAYRKVVDPRSGTSEQGRDFCLEIEKASGIPTYYFLDRFYGLAEKEGSRPCPSCGGRWRLPKPFVHKGRDWHIAFLCKKCRLVSEPARTFGTKREALIGYRGVAW